MDTAHLNDSLGPRCMGFDFPLNPEALCSLSDSVYQFMYLHSTIGIYDALETNDKQHRCPKGFYNSYPAKGSIEMDPFDGV